MSKPARPAGPNPLQGKDLWRFFRRYSITPQSARCGPFLGCARDSIRPTLLPLAGASRIQPSTAHWTILLTEILPVPRACLGGFPDSISLASHRPVSDPSGIAANFNRCLFSHQSYELWFPKSVLRQIAGVEPNAFKNIL